MKNFIVAVKRCHPYTDRHTEWDMTAKNMRKILIYCFHLLQANNFFEQVGGESPEESY